MAKRRRKTMRPQPKAKDKIHQPAWDNEMQQTYQARLSTSPAADACLAAMAGLHSHLKHKLFALIIRHGIHKGNPLPDPAGIGEAGKSAKDRTAKAIIRQQFCRQEHISVRQFNALWDEVMGIIAAVTNGRDYQIEILAARIDSQKEKIEKLEKQAETGDTTKKRKNARFVLHHKKRKLAGCVDRLGQLEADRAEQRIPWCDGSKKLFHAQFHLKENGYEDHDQWLADWQAKRASQFFVLGCKEETAGCSECQLRKVGEHSFTIRLRVPDALREEFGPFIELEDLAFGYGEEVILAALEECQERGRLKSAGDDAYQQLGLPLSFRFQKDDKGWQVKVSFALRRPKIITHRKRGVIAADLNADHIAVCETDAHGNPLYWFAIPLLTYGLSQGQAEALTGEAVKELVAWAALKQKPLVIEHLDFKGKKARLKEGYNRYARMLSSFAYRRFCDMLTARAFREGVQLWKVRPAYTSVIGRVNWAERCGMTVHQAAALVIGRRFLRLSEKPAGSWENIPDGRNGHVAIDVPARKRSGAKPRTMHNWSVWRGISKVLTAALAARRQEERDALLKERERRRSIARAGKPACVGGG